MSSGHAATIPTSRLRREAGGDGSRTLIVPRYGGGRDKGDRSSTGVAAG